MTFYLCTVWIKRNVVYFKASIDSPIDRQVYKVSLEGGAAVSITPAQGDNNNVIFHLHLIIIHGTTTPSIHRL